jgi:hypothetical protein
MTGINKQHGDLLFIPQNGEARVFEHNLPFGVLQQLKKQYIQQGFSKEKLKITYSRN